MITKLRYLRLKYARKLRSTPNERQSTRIDSTRTEVNSKYFLIKVVSVRLRMRVRVVGALHCQALLQLQYLLPVALEQLPKPFDEADELQSPDTDCQEEAGDDVEVVCGLLDQLLQHAPEPLSVQAEQRCV